MMNQNFDRMFDKMEAIITKFKNQEKREEVKECNHEETIVSDGATVCIKCGETLEFLFDNYNILGRMNLNFRPYETKKHLKNLLRRLSGHYFTEKREVDFNEIPKDLKKIRTYLRKNKLNMKNDFYYYRVKNNMNIKIPNGEIEKMESQYNRELNRKQTKLSPKDYAFQKLCEIEKYKELSILVKRKS